MTRNANNALKEATALFAAEAAKNTPVEDEVTPPAATLDDDENYTPDPDNAGTGDDDEIIDADTVDDEQTDEITAAATGDDEVRTLAQLAEAIEVDAEYLYSIEVGMGEGEDAIPLGKLKDEYQAAIKIQKQQAEQLEEQAGQLNQASDLTQMGQGVSQEMMLAFSRMDSIKDQYDQTDWQKLESDDPGEAALMKQKFQEAFNAAQGQAGEAQNRMQEYKQQSIQASGEIMLNIIPEWKDVEVRKTDQAEIRKLLIAEGSNDDHINQIADPVAMKLLRELVQWRAKGAEAQQATRKLHKAPKVLKNRGKLKADPKQNLKNLKNAVRTARPSGKRKAELAAVKAILGASVKQRSGR